MTNTETGLSLDEAHQRACMELLRQAAQRAGVLAADDAVGEDGVFSEAAADAIELLLERELKVSEPADEDCRRYYAANPARYAQGERVHARHILFAVTPGVDVRSLASRAQKLLLELRAPDAAAHAADARVDAFAAAAREWSNCPSGAAGGELGWLRRDDCAPEFARELFGQPAVGVLPRLVRTRFGLHLVEVLAREPGQVPPFEAVRGVVATTLRQQAWSTALRRYLDRLAGPPADAC